MTGEVADELDSIDVGVVCDFGRRSTVEETIQCGHEGILQFTTRSLRKLQFVVSGDIEVCIDQSDWISEIESIGPPHLLDSRQNTPAFFRRRSCPDLSVED